MMAMTAAMVMHDENDALDDADEQQRPVGQHALEAAAEDLADAALQITFRR